MLRSCVPLRWGAHAHAHRFGSLPAPRRTLQSLSYMILLIYPLALRSPQTLASKPAHNQHFHVKFAHLFIF